MQYRVYERQTLKYISGGYVQYYTIDDDYIVNNNSTITAVKNYDNSFDTIVVGDIIALIQDSGAFHKGVITSVDSSTFSISYKSDKELFNDNVPNLHSSDFANNSNIVSAGTFGVDDIIDILKAWFVDTDDSFKSIPAIFIADGDVVDENGNSKMLWTWSDDSINLVDWLTELFEKYNLSLSWDIDFDTSKDLFLETRNPNYIVTLSAVSKSNGIIKDNVAMQTITYTVKELPEATVCRVIDSASKQLIEIFYLYDNNGFYSIANESNVTDGRQRVLPVKTVIASLNQNSGTGNTSVANVAIDKLIPSQFNQAIEIKINSDSKMFDFVNAKFGDQYQIINEQGNINSVFTGKKLSNKNKWVTLYFGLGRQNYTDLVQIKMRKQKYTEVYNG